MVTRRTFLRTVALSAFLAPTLARALPPALGVLDALQPTQRGHPLLRRCRLWLLMLPRRQAMGAPWRSLAGGIHGTPINFLPQATATRGLAQQTTRRGGYGEMRLPGTNSALEGGVQLPPDQLQFVEGVTLALWLNMPGLPTAGSQRILVAGAGIADRAYGIHTVTGTTTLKFRWNGVDRLTTTGSLGFGTWRHVVVTREGVTGSTRVVRWYLDGRLDVASSPISSDPAATAGDYTTIGCRSDGALVPYVLMDDIMIYDRVLNAPDVQALYEDGLAGHPHLLRWHRPPSLAQGGQSRVRIRSQTL